MVRMMMLVFLLLAPLLVLALAPLGRVLKCTTSPPRTDRAGKQSSRVSERSGVERTSGQS